MKRFTKEDFRKLFLGLFPSPRAYANFAVLWVFLIVLVSTNDLLTALISSFATIYCFNEWSKEALKNEWD